MRDHERRRTLETTTGVETLDDIQRLLDDRIKATGHENCYFPLFIPLSYFEKEASHVDGFAKETSKMSCSFLSHASRYDLPPSRRAVWSLLRSSLVAEKR